MKNKIIILIITLSFWRCTVCTCECCKTETIFDVICPIMGSTNHNNVLSHNNVFSYNELTINRRRSLMCMTLISMNRREYS